MNQKTLVPISILIAALIIAGAIFLSNKPGSDNIHTDGHVAIEVSEVTGGDWIRGEVDARIKIVEFSDTECPFCKRYHETLNELITEYDGSDLAWVYRHLPLQSLHPKAPFEANATECAGELGGVDGFWNFINKVYEITPANNGLDLAILPDLAEEVGLDREAFEACADEIRYRDEVEKDIADAIGSADHLGGNVGTPYSIFIVEEGFSDVALGVFDSINTTYKAQIGRNLVAVSDDNTKASVSGALPKELMVSMIDSILGR